MKLISPLKNLKLFRTPDGNIFQYYAENPQLYFRLGMNGHNGWDLVTKENDEVHSVCDGYVLKCDYGETSFGKGIWILSKPEENRALMTVYFHLNQIYVKEGQEVKAGDIIGLEGNTGFIISGNTPFWGNAPAGRGVHLHFGAYSLIEGRDKNGNAYWIEGRPFSKEYPDNGYNGAVNPFDYYPSIVFENAHWVIQLAKDLILKVKSFLKIK